MTLLFDATDDAPDVDDFYDDEIFYADLDPLWDDERFGYLRDDDEDAWIERRAEERAGA
jgi:hypothetical protein